MSYGNLDADFGKQANLADKRFVLASVYSGEALDWIPKVATVDDGECVTAEVGKYAPNAWGLYDMHGNAAEWTCSLDRPYPYHDDDGRNDPSAAGHRVVRGGSFHDRPHRARSAFRFSYPAWSGVYNVGFRVVQRGCTAVGRCVPKRSLGTSYRERLSRLSCNQVGWLAEPTGSG